MVCKKSVFPQIIILITNNYMFPAPLPFIFFFIFLDVNLNFFSFCFFFFFFSLIGLVSGKEGDLGFWGTSICLFTLPGEFLACFLTVKTTFPFSFPLSPLHSLPFPSIQSSVFPFVQVTERRYFFVIHLWVWWQGAALVVGAFSFC